MSKKTTFVLIAAVLVVAAVIAFGGPVVGWLTHTIAVMHGRH